MDKYFIIIDGLQQGPFTIGELKDKNIAGTTLVWTDNMENWNEAKSIDALKIIIKKNPPPIPQQIKDTLIINQAVKRKELKNKSIKQNVKALLYSSLFGVVFFLLSFYYNDGFANLRMYNKYKTYINSPRKISQYGIVISNFWELRDESIKLGWGENDYFGHDGDLIQSFHEKKYKEAASQSMLIGIISLGIAYLSFMIAIYFSKNKIRTKGI